MRNEQGLVQVGDKPRDEPVFCNLHMISLDRIYPSHAVPAKERPRAVFVPIHTYHDLTGVEPVPGAEFTPNITRFPKSRSTRVHRLRSGPSL